MIFEKYYEFVRKREREKKLIIMWSNVVQLFKIGE